MREEVGAAPIESFRVPDESETEEQRQEWLKQEALRKAEVLKKNKQKPKTEEQEAQELEQIIQSVVDRVVQTTNQVEADKIERDIQIIQTKWLMDNHIKMDDAMFDSLNRKVSVLDIDISEQEIILRADLDVPLSPYVPMPSIEEEFKSFFDQ